MQPSVDSQTFPFSFGTWLVLFVFGVWLLSWLGWIAFLRFSKDEALKRKVNTVMLVGNSVLFLMYVWAMGFTRKGMYFVVSAVALVLFLNLRGTKFFDSCGRNIRGLFSRVYGSNLMPQDLSRLDSESIARAKVVLGAVAGVVVALLQHFYLSPPSVMDKYPASAPSFVDSVSRFWYLINSMITRPYVALVLGVSLLVLSWHRRHEPKEYTLAFLGGLLLPYAVFWIAPR